MPKDKCAPVFGKRDPDPSRPCALDMAGRMAGLGATYIVGRRVYDPTARP